MNATVIPFPAKKSRPNAVQVQFDLGEWSLAYFSDRRFLSRLSFPSKDLAEADAIRFARDLGAEFHIHESNEGGAA